MTTPLWHLLQLKIFRSIKPTGHGFSVFIVMDITQLIGIVASIGTGISLLPQLITLTKEKKAERISLGMMGVLLSGLILWVIYGIRKEDWIIIISNSVSLLLNLTIIVLTLKYKR